MECGWRSREAHPHQQYLHTNGALRCCDQGGCWKARVVPLGDGDGKDAPENLCVDVVELATGRRARGEDWGREHAALFARDGAAAAGFRPRCLEMISAVDVIRRIELYFEGGALRHLTDEERRACEEGIPRLAGAGIG